MGLFDDIKEQKRGKLFSDVLTDTLPSIEPTEEGQRAEEFLQKGVLGQLFSREFASELGEVSGIKPTARKTAAIIAPFVVPEEELPDVIEQLVGGVRTPPPSFGGEVLETALDLPIPTAALERPLAGALTKIAAKKAPILAKPLTKFLPKTVQKALATPLFGTGGKVIKETTEEISKKEIRPLAQEARKYKSAEEFVNQRLSTSRILNPQFDAITESPSFKEWFGKSKTVEPAGNITKKETPQIFYHRSPRSFESFSANAKSPDYRDTDAGFYFSRKDPGDFYGENEYAVFLKAENIKNTRGDISSFSQSKISGLKKQGFDAIESPDEIVVFSSKQIRPYTRNQLPISDTKSQLTDIYKQAVGAEARGLEPLAQEAQRAFETPEFAPDISERTGKELLEVREAPKRLETLNEKIKDAQTQLNELSEKGREAALLRDRPIVTGKEKAKARIEKTTGIQKELPEVKKIKTLENKMKDFVKKRNDLLNTPEVKNIEEARALGLENPEQVISTRGVIVKPKDAIELSKTKDLGRIEAGQLLSAIDPIRAAEKGDQSLRGIVKRIFIEPVQKARTAMQEESETILKEFNDLTKKAGVSGLTFLKRLTPEGAQAIERNARMFRYGEGQATKEDLLLLSPDEKNLVHWTRGKYDEFLGRINEIRAKLNLKLVPRRENYITHIRQLTFFERLGNELATIPDAALEGIEIKPASPAFRFIKERLGGAFDEDIVQAFTAYLQPAMRQIHFNEPAAAIRAHATFLPKNAERYWQRFASQRLMGKESTLDKFVRDNVPGLLNVLDALRRQTSKGAIIGNISTVALQPSTIASTYATTSGKRVLNAIWKSFSKEGDDFALSNSQILRNRQFEIEIDPNTMKKFENFFNWSNKTLDQFMVKHSFHASYEKGIKDFGLSHEAAVRYADTIAGKTQAIYDRLFVPDLIASKVGGVFTQFQTFSFNLWNQLVRDPKILAKGSERERLQTALNVGKLTLGMYGVNKIYESFGLPEPYEFREMVPIVGGVARRGPTPVPKFLLSVNTLAFSDDPQEVSQALRTLKSVGVTFFPLGNQMRKTVEGMMAISEGSVKVKNKKVPIEGIGEELRTILFGKFGAKAVREEFEKK